MPDSRKQVRKTNKEVRKTNRKVKGINKNLKKSGSPLRMAKMVKMAKPKKRVTKKK